MSLKSALLANFAVVMKWHKFIIKENENFQLNSLRSIIRDDLSHPMIEYKPIIEDNVYKGFRGKDAELLKPAILQIDSNIIDALSTIENYDLDFIAVCDENEFLGIITLNDIIKNIASIYSFKETGSSIWFYCSDNKPVSSELIHSLELENIRILTFSVDFIEDTHRYLNYIRIDQLDPNQTLETLERLGCDIKGYYPKGSRGMEFEKKLEHLSHFLSIE
jgi:hypothetical protein